MAPRSLLEPITVVASTLHPNDSPLLRSGSQLMVGVRTLHNYLCPGFQLVSGRGTRVKTLLDELYGGSQQVSRASGHFRFVALCGVLPQVYTEEYPALLRLSEVGNLVSHHPDRARALIHQTMHYLLPEAREQVSGWRGSIADCGSLPVCVCSCLAALWTQPRSAACLVCWSPFPATARPRRLQSRKRNGTGPRRSNGWPQRTTRRRPSGHSTRRGGRKREQALP